MTAENKPKLTGIKLLIAKKEKLEAQIQDRENRQAETDRKLDTHKKILVGATFLDLIKTKQMPKSELTKVLDIYLTRKSDRKIFGLPALLENQEPQAKRIEIKVLPAVDPELVVETETESDEIYASLNTDA